MRNKEKVSSSNRMDTGSLEPHNRQRQKPRVRERFVRRDETNGLDLDEFHNTMLPCVLGVLLLSLCDKSVPFEVAMRGWFSLLVCRFASMLVMKENTDVRYLHTQAFNVL